MDSYLSIGDNDNSVKVAIIENFIIESNVDSEGNASRKYIIEAFPLGIIADGKFMRGGDTLTIPPKEVKPALKKEI